MNNANSYRVGDKRLQKNKEGDKFKEEKINWLREKKQEREKKDGKKLRRG